MSPYLWVVRKRLPIILLTMVSALIIAYLIGRQSVNLYTAATQMLLTPYGIDRPDNASNLYFQQATNTFSVMLHGETVTTKAKKRLGVEALPSFDLQALPNSELIELTVTDKTAASARRTADILANTLIDTVRTRYNANSKNIERDLEQLLTQREEKIRGLVQERIQAVRNNTGNGRVGELDRLINANKNAYIDLIERQNQASVSAATQASLVSLYQPATVSSAASSSRLPLTLLASAIAGLLGGLALAFILEGARPRLYTLAQVEASLGKNILATLPPGKYTGAQIVTDGRAHKRILEALRHLRAVLINQLDSHEHPVILVTSPKFRDNHSFVANNLAESFSRGRAKTLLVDINANAPTAQRAFNVADDLGLTDIITRKLPMEQVIQESPSGVHVITIGTQKLAAADLVSSRAMRQIIDELKQRYDYVVINSNQLVISSDALALAPFADIVLLVLKRDSSEAFASKATKELSGAPVGIILNGWS